MHSDHVISSIALFAPYLPLKDEVETISCLHSLSRCHFDGLISVGAGLHVRPCAYTKYDWLTNFGSQIVYHSIQQQQTLQHSIILYIWMKVGFVLSEPLNVNKQIKAHKSNK